MKVNTSLMAFLACVCALSPALAQFDFDAPPPVPEWEKFKLDPKVRVKLDFRNSSVDAVMQTLSRASGIPIVKDPALTTPITLQSPKPQTLKDAFAMFNAALSLRGYELKKGANWLEIRGGRQQGRGGRGGNIGFAGGPSGFNPGIFSGLGDASQGSLKVYAIKYANATQVARVINEVFANMVNPMTMFGQPGGGGGGGGFPFPPNPAGGPGAPAAPGVGGGQVNPAQGNRGGPNASAQFGGGGGQGRFGGGGGFGGFGGGGGQGRFGGFGNRGGNNNLSPVKASADDFSNSVIVYAPTREHDQITKIISQIDKQTAQPQTSQVYSLRYANSVDLAPVVQNVLVSNAPRGRGGIGAQNVPIDQRFQQAARFGSPQAAFGTVAAEQRTNSLVVTATQENLDIVTKVIEQLDKPVTFANSAFVITLQNARADAVADLLNQSFSGRNSGLNSLNRNTANRGTGSASNRRQGNNNNSNSLGNSQPGGLGGRAAQRSEPADPAVDEEAGTEDDKTRAAQFQGGFGGGGFGGGQFGGGFGGQQRFGGGFGQQRQQNLATGQDASGRIVNVRDLTGGVTAIPDINTNSVIIVTAPQNKFLLDQILTQLDRIPEQVMIETLIVEASLDATSRFGVEWSAVSGESSATSSFGLQSNTAQPQGLRYTLTGNQYGAFLQAIKTDSRFEILSTPRIFTSNNATAEINISQSLPYVLNQRVDVNGNLLYNYAFLDVGIILTVTPRITSNGYVTMDVTQTANDFVRYTDFNAPVVNQREAQTTVSVKDGETIALGGIIKNSTTSTVNKIPILGDIPLIGNLFRSTSKQNTKTELLVFLTPKIVRDAEEARKLREKTQKQMQSKTLQKYFPEDSNASEEKSKSDKPNAEKPAPEKAEPEKAVPEKSDAEKPAPEPKP